MLWCTRAAAPSKQRFTWRALSNARNRPRAGRPLVRNAYRRRTPPRPSSHVSGKCARMTAASSQLGPKLLLKSLRAFRKGDFSVRLPLDLTGIDGEIAEAFNAIVELNQGLARELDRVARTVGKDGRIG